MLPLRINAMQAEWMSYTRLYCPAGHKYSPLPVDNWWQKRWLAGSQANPVQPGWKKSLWHRNSLGPSPHSTQGQLFLQSDWIQFTSGDNHRCHRRHPLPLNGIKSLIVSAILANSCELCASSKPHLFTFNQIDNWFHNPKVPRLLNIKLKTLSIFVCLDCHKIWLQALAMAAYKDCSKSHTERI